MSDELTLDAAVVRIGELVRDVDKLNTNWKNELSRRVDAETERDALALELQSVKDALAQVVAENTANVAALAEMRELLEALQIGFSSGRPFNSAAQAKEIDRVLRPAAPGAQLPACKGGTGFCTNEWCGPCYG